MYSVQLISRSNSTKRLDIPFHSTILGDLACSGGSAEIEIDGYDPRGFRFPPIGSNGFPV